MTRAEQNKNWRQVAINSVVSVGGVCLLASYPLVCALVMGLLFVHTARLWNARRDFLVAASALVFGVTLELVATESGLWKYADVTWGKLPAWVFTLWPVFMIGLPRLAETIAPDSSGPSPSAQLKLGLGLSILAGEIPCLGIWGNEKPWLVTTLTALALIVILLALKSRQVLLMALVGASFGGVCEALPVHLGIWTYARPVFLGLPPWLAPGYALFGVGVVHVALGVDEIWRERERAASKP